MNILQRIARYLAHIIGLLRQGLRAKWVSPLAGFLSLIVLVAAADYFFATTPLQPFAGLNESWKHKLGDWLNIWVILAIYTLCLLVWSLWGTSRMVVEKFVNYAGKDFDDVANGASMMLLVKLGQLHDLYRVVDEQRAIPTAALNQSIPLERSTVVDAAINVDNIETFLKDAVTMQSTLDVGPIHIPVGTLLSLLGYVARGPRIISSFHKDKSQDGKDLLILTAQSTRRNGRPFTWRIEHALAPEQPLSVSISDMLDEFACRIFTDMTLRSTVRWRATARFTEGLRAYRECLRTPKDRMINLQLAEEKFIEALTEDTQYTFAHYNLGVVLTELQRNEAARAAFESVISEDPRSYQACYALALNCYQDRQFYRTSQICKRVIELKPDLGSMAKACQLRAMALLELDPDSNKISHEAVHECKKAIKYAHKTLRRVEINQQDDGTGNPNIRVFQAESLLGVCIGSLAKIYLPKLLDSKTSLSPIDDPKPLASNQWALKEAKRLLDAAVELCCADALYEALYHWELSRIYCVKGKYQYAAHHLRIAARAAPDRIEYVADLIFNQAHLSLERINPLLQGNKSASLGQEKYEKKYEDNLFNTFLDLASTTKEEILSVALKTVQKAYDFARKEYGNLGGSISKAAEYKAEYEERCNRLRMIQVFLQLGYSVGISLTGEKLVQSYRKQEEEYNACDKKCYLSNVKCLKNYTLAGNDTSVAVAEINKTLCLSEMALACGRILLQLSKEGQNGTAYLSGMQESSSDLDTRVQKLLDRLDAQVQVTDAMTEIGRMLCLSEMALACGRIQWQLSKEGQNGTVSLEGVQRLLDGLDQKGQSIQKQSGWEWERGHILSILARLYEETGKHKQEMEETDRRDSGRIGLAPVRPLSASAMGELDSQQLFERASSYYSNAIRVLKEKHPHSISVQGLRSLLASVLLQQDRLQEALKVAQESVAVDAMNHKNFETLGDVYFACEDFRNAIETWKQAVSRKNTTIEELNDPDLYVKLGRAYAALAQSGHGICLNDQQCQEAIHYLEYAMKYCNDEQVSQRLDIYRSLGYLYGTRGDYDQAIEILLEAVELEGLSSIYLLLAQACLNKSANLSDGFEKQQLLANVRTYCEKARDQNSNNDKALGMQIDDLLNRLVPKS